MRFFQNVAAGRLKELADIADQYGQPWYFKLEAERGRLSPVAEGWYQTY
jgi:hypothetical protein